MKVRALFIFIVLLFLIFSASFMSLSKIKNSRVAGVSSEVQWEKSKVLIVPHHGLAKDLIVGAYEKLPRDNYDYVVLVGTNHFSPESETFVIADGYFAQELASFGNVAINDEMITGDHSITIQLPYIRERFPSAQVLPILVSPHYSMKNVDRVLKFLHQNLPEKTLFIASVDFSHETQRIEAIERNEESINAIENFDYKQLSQFTDLNMDSPLSIIIVAKLAAMYVATNWETLYSSHASIIENDETIRGTSYVVGAFMPK